MLVKEILNRTIAGLATGFYLGKALIGANEYVNFATKAAMSWFNQ